VPLLVVRASVLGPLTQRSNTAEILPDVGSFDTSMHFTDEELAELEGSELYGINYQLPTSHQSLGK